MRPLLIVGGLFGFVLLIALVVAVWPKGGGSRGGATNSAATNAVLLSGGTNALVSNTVIPVANTAVPPAADNSVQQTQQTDQNQQTDQGAPPQTNDQVNYYETVVSPDGPPAQLAGARLITTAQMVQVMRARDAGQLRFDLIDARGCTDEPTIPGAACLSPNNLDSLEERDPSRSGEIVIFCHDGRCPMSYQLAAQAVQAGYTGVFWYRGGINAWTAGGNPTASFDNGGKQ